MDDLRAYTTDELLEELARRNRRGDERREIKRWCEDCKHFTFWRKPGDPPDDYNACGKGHTMSFRVPESYHGDDGGFYRRVCADRIEQGSSESSGQ